MSELLAQGRHEQGGSRFREELLVPEGGDSEAESGWMLIYLDVLTLLLVLFIVLLAFSDPDPSPPQAAPETLVIPVPAPATGTALLPGTEQPGMEAEPAAREMDGPDLETDRVEVIEERDRVSLRIQDSLLFQSGAASLTTEGTSVLDELVQVLQDHPGQISVEGHTDNVPIRTQAFPSNWELSTARATEVLRYLESAGVPAERMRAVGRADTDPVAPNTNAPGRAANRRVDLILHRDDEQTAP